ncbi:MAG: 2-isopropylmalate synthase [Propionibacteriaceae bacterium]|jgi:2-isopropylmalate synthase|nr:2-isopropylmalate synthase [Propionibacteriaceae bacterium]
MTTLSNPATKVQPQPVATPTPMPYQRYQPHIPLTLPDRTWPDNQLTRAPRWLSTDLRDGNQALIEPMTPARKRRMFDLLVSMGYKEIEVGFPSASATEFDFIRSLIEDETAIPDGVTISVLTQARADLIETTAKSLIGARRATIHVYNALSPLFRRVVFGLDEAQTIALARQGTQWVIDAADRYLKDTEFGYEYSPEIFTQTPTDYAVEVCNNVMQVWQPGPNREIILNLPATVEMCTPNVYADMIEYFGRHIDNREYVCLSLHTHNDRGTGIAATELGLLAGGQRVEGCLFGHGERTGNVDLVVLGMNLYSQGIDPGIDFSHMDEIRRVVEYCTGMKVPPRQPYSGDLVYTAFSGSHQDAIKKGLEDLERQAAAQGVGMHEIPWEAPYLAVDPVDVGRNYEAIIRVNSQSGKGGMAYLMKNDHKLDLPRRLQQEFSRLVQARADAEGGELASDQLWNYFQAEYLTRTTPLNFQERHTSASGAATSIDAHVTFRGTPEHITGEGNGPLSAFVDALRLLGIYVKVLDYAEHAMTSGGDAQAAAYVECEIGENGDAQVAWGVGIDPDITNASLRAVVSAVNRVMQ